jgi:hypothetical protein
MAAKGRALFCRSADFFADAFLKIPVVVDLKHTVPKSISVSAAHQPAATPLTAMIVRAVPPPPFDCQFDRTAPTPASATNKAPQTKRHKQSATNKAPQTKRHKQSAPRTRPCRDAAAPWSSRPIAAAAAYSVFLSTRADLKNIFVRQYSDGSDASALRAPMTISFSGRGPSQPRVKGVNRRLGEPR